MCRKAYDLCFHHTECLCDGACLLFSVPPRLLHRAAVLDLVAVTSAREAPEALALPVEIGLQSVQIFLDVVDLCLQAVGLCLDCRQNSFFEIRGVCADNL